MAHSDKVAHVAYIRGHRGGILDFLAERPDLLEATPLTLASALQVDGILRRKEVTAQGLETLEEFQRVGHTRRSIRRAERRRLRKEQHWRAIYIASLFMFSFMMVVGLVGLVLIKLFSR